MHAKGWGMKGVELYAKVRYAVRIEGISGREAGRRFGIDPRTVAKMLSFSLPLDTGAAGRWRAGNWILLWGSSSGSWKRTACRTAPPSTRCGQSATSTLPTFKLSTHHEDLAGTDHLAPPGPPPLAPSGNRAPWECSIRPRRQKAPAGTFWHSSLMHFCSGPPMLFCSDVDSRVR